MRGKYRSISLSQNVLANTKFATSPAEWDASVFWTTPPKIYQVGPRICWYTSHVHFMCGGGRGSRGTVREKCLDRNTTQEHCLCMRLDLAIQGPILQQFRFFCFV